MDVRTYSDRNIGEKVERPVEFTKPLRAARPVGVGSGGAAGTLVPISYGEWRITHDDLTAAATSEAIALTGFPANAAPIFAEVKVETDFAGGSASAATVVVGDAGATNELLTSTNIFTGVQNTAWIQTTGATLNSDFQREAAYAPIATVATTDDNVVNLTAGSLLVRIYYALLPA